MPLHKAQYVYNVESKFYRILFRNIYVKLYLYYLLCNVIAESKRKKMNTYHYLPSATPIRWTACEGSPSTSSVKVRGSSTTSPIHNSRARLHLEPKQVSPPGHPLDPWHHRLPIPNPWQRGPSSNSSQRQGTERSRAREAEERSPSEHNSVRRASGRRCRGILATCSATRSSRPALAWEVTAGRSGGCSSRQEEARAKAPPFRDSAPLR